MKVIQQRLVVKPVLTVAMKLLVQSVQ
jgi:hypothetical protein